MELRAYQSKALEMTRESFARGSKKVLLHMATGGGKTVVFCHIMKGALERGRRSMMVVHGKKLVDQASRRLDREGVDHGVIMAGHWRHRPLLPIQVASIDTLYARRKKDKLPQFDLIVIDEAHMAASNSFIWLIENYKDSFFLAVTATPHVKRGLRHIADTVVYPISIKDLIDQAYLVPPEYYAPSKPSLENVKIDKKTGDYNLEDLSEAMQKTNLYGDMVTSYRKFALDLPTLLFCVDVKHSKAVSQVFNMAGINAEHVDASMSDAERNEVISRFESGETKVITNVGIFTTGVDIPCVQCIMLARPTKSYNLYIQILGRATRPYPGKTKFYVLDHADCVSEHGFIEKERKCSLDGETFQQRAIIVTCKLCYHVWDPVDQWLTKNPGTVGKDYICQGVISNQVCGYDNTPVRTESDKIRELPVTDEGYELKKITEIDDNTNVKLRIRSLVELAITKGYAKPAGWVYHQLKMDKAFGSVVANQHYKFINKVVKESL